MHRVAISVSRCPRRRHHMTSFHSSAQRRHVRKNCRSDLTHCCLCHCCKLHIILSLLVVVQTTSLSSKVHVHADDRAKKLSASNHTAKEPCHPGLTRRTFASRHSRWPSILNPHVRTSQISTVLKDESDHVLGPAVPEDFKSHARSKKYCCNPHSC